jgi:alpha-1,2-mannosyltransferase
LIQDPENQSLLGALARTMHTANVLPVGLPLAAAVAAVGLALAAAASRRGDEALGFSLCAVTGLLISPISWTHHWVIAIPALPVAGLAVYHAYRAGKMAAAGLGQAGIMAIAVIGWDRLARNVPGANWLDLSSKALVHSVAYVLIGLLVLVLAAGYWLRESPHRASSRPPVSSPSGDSDGVRLGPGLFQISAKATTRGRSSIQRKNNG